MKVLILDNLQEVAIDVFHKNSIQVDVKGKMESEDLAKIIDDYDGVVLRGATRINQDVVKNTLRLKIIGRAGSGTDNIDTNIATRKGIVVMNTPGGNTITTGEHAIALMLALARKVPQATASMKDGKWEKNSFIGTELTGKVLGIIGLGNVGKAVAERGLGLKMKVLGYDPYVHEEDVIKLGIQLVKLDEIYNKSDFITYHTPLTPETKGMINAEAINKMKKGAFIINCARGGLVNEDDLLKALNSGQLSGVALDVYEVEPPPKNSPLLNHANVILTPHLGASTMEAQEKVAILIAEQISDFLNKGIIRNSINFPSISSDLLSILKPYLDLCEKLGSFVGQLLEGPLKELQVEYLGEASKLEIAPLTISVIKGFLKHQTEDVNLVNARIVAEERGIKVTETRGLKAGNFASMIRVTAYYQNIQKSVSGALFGKLMKILEVNHFPIEADLIGGILMLENQDVPGVVGNVGRLLGEKEINIAGYQLGRNEPGGTAISLINVDNYISEGTLIQLSRLPNVTSAKFITVN